VRERTLLKILGDEGSAHLRSVLMTIMQTDNNKLMLVAPVIWAVSDVLRGHPSWFGDAWFKEIDKIDLGELHANAKKSREAVAPRHAIATMLIERLRPLFTDHRRRGFYESVSREYQSRQRAPCRYVPAHYSAATRPEVCLR